MWMNKDSYAKSVIRPLIVKDQWNSILMLSTILWKRKTLERLRRKKKYALFVKKDLFGRDHNPLLLTFVKDAIIRIGEKEEKKSKKVTIQA